MRLLLLLILLVVNSTGIASDFFLINTPFPALAKTVENVTSLPENIHEYDTPLGVTSRCYQGRHYLIMSRNTSGSGYEFTFDQPKDVHCVKLSSDSSPLKNEAGVMLGMLKKSVQSLFNIPSDTDKATLLFSKSVKKNGLKFDEQVWVDVEFAKQKLIYLKVFTSLTQ